MASRTLLALGLAAALIGAAAGCRARLTPAELADPAITARVKALLDGHPELDIRYLDLNTHMRIVTISGMVDSVEAKQKISSLVRRVAGVQQVVVNVAVQE
ncbi:MAG: BON domain-containing protein [Elusimicrobia bacterium]|nr:BON domain-containing protein [Elusimicrobiota bacterium]